MNFPETTSSTSDSNMYPAIAPAGAQPVLPNPTSVENGALPTLLPALPPNTVLNISSGFTTTAATESMGNATNNASSGNVVVGMPYLIPKILNPQAPHHPIAEFLYQLTKMLTDDNREVIEWCGYGGCGRINVHDPQRLAQEVLHNYFRHSKYASFQRQLNYFGFRKIAGKGKMSPCSYVNDSATEDLGSLLFIKRKTNGSSTKRSGQTCSKAPTQSASSPTDERHEQHHSGQKRVWADTIPSSETGNAMMGSTNSTTKSNNIAHASPLEVLSHQVPSFEKPQNPILPRNTASFNGMDQSSNCNQYQHQQQQPSPMHMTHKDHSMNEGSNNFAEQLHFPSEKTIAALVARQNTSTDDHVPQKDDPTLTHKMGSQWKSSQVLVSPEMTLSNTNIGTSSCPATEAMNAEYSCRNQGNQNDIFDSNDDLSSLLGYGSNQNEASSMPPPSNKAKSGNGLMSCLPSKNTLFPDSCASLSRLLPSSNATDDGGFISQSTSQQYFNMLSPNSSLVDLAVVPKAGIAGQVEASSSEEEMRKNAMGFSSGGGIVG